MNKKILIVQRILPSYRAPVFSDIANLTNCEVTIFAAKAEKGYGNSDNEKFNLSYARASWKQFFGILYFDKSIFSLWRKHDIIFHVADFKFTSLWISLFLSIFSSKKVYLHGQGGYKRKGLLVNIIYKFILLLADGYVCYTDYSKATLLDKVPKFMHKKISVCSNTLVIDSVDQVLQKNVENSLLYIGRLRKKCDIEVLLEAASRSGAHVRVIGLGDTEYMDSLKEQFGSIATFYGSVYDEKEQQDIAKSCVAGVYGGDAGLSVVHYMALGLPVIIHGDISKHMGPEPSYVEEGVNGLLFDRKNIQSLSEKITLLLQDDDYRQKIALGSLATFKGLAKPTMSEKLSKIMGLL